MKSQFIQRQKGNTRLILIFAGWGMDQRPFASLTCQGYDIMVVWNYTDLSFSWKKALEYDEICLIAWSMGVFAASLTIHQIEPRITKRIAVGGTLTPISASKGIPPAIFAGTLNTLSSTTLRKFHRRMCNNAEQYGAFAQNLPRRTILDLQEELRAIETLTIFHTPQITQWDMALVGRNDAIFPYRNQLDAWQGTTTVITDDAHLPSFQSIINTYIINKDKVNQRFTSAAQTYPQHATAQAKIAQTLFSLFTRVYGSDKLCGNILEIGPGTGALTQLYVPGHTNGKITLWDIAQTDLKAIAPTAQHVQTDAEIAIRRHPTRSEAIIFSTSTLQWFNSPATFLRECARVLIPGGWLAISAFVAGNLPEINLDGEIELPLPTMAAWKKMIPDNLEIYVCQNVTLPLEFTSPRKVLEHLSATGVNALGHSGASTTAARKLLANYPLSANGSCLLTYKPIFIIARKNDQLA